MDNEVGDTQQALSDLNITQDLSVNSGFKPKSIFTPVLASDNTIDTFQRLVVEDLNKLEKKIDEGKSHISFNISKNERLALKNLSDNRDIVIKEADKGGNIVILNRLDYINEINRQLTDKTSYIELKDNPLSKIVQDLEILLR
ncbi:hypothetical protein NDU88_003053, partial [Pleurodeles waltl]